MPTPTLYGRAGVYVTENLIGPAPAVSTTSPSTAGFVGEHWRGPVGKAVQCQSWAQFVQYFGGFNPNAVPVLANPYLPYAVYAFFQNGGGTAWVSRIGASGQAGAASAKTLYDQAATPQATLSLQAGFYGSTGSLGTWGNSIYVDVVSQGTGLFGLNIYWGGSTSQYLVEQWSNLSMVKNSSRYALTVLNAPGTGSLWVIATDLGSASASPTNTPAAVTASQFTGGVDPADPSLSDREAAVTLGTCPFDYVPGALSFTMPGETSTAVLTSALTYAETRPYTFMVVDTASGQTPANAVTYEQSLTPVVSNGAVYYPWLNMINPNGNQQSTVLTPPSGFVLGQMAAIDASQGVWRAPAGNIAQLTGIAGAERTFSPTDLNTLNLSNVNALKTRANGQVVIWGARTLQTGYASLYVPVRRTLNYVESSLAQLLEFAIFAPNDGALWATIVATCGTFLSGLYSAGAFAGNTSATSYYVICDGTNNTPQTIAQGVVNTTVGLALLYPAEFVALNIAQFQSSGQTIVTA